MPLQFPPRSRLSYIKLSESFLLFPFAPFCLSHPFPEAVSKQGLGQGQEKGGKGRKYSGKK